MQCTNQDQYRTIYAHSVCVCVLAFDILIYLYRAHNGFAGWSVVRLACSVLYLHPNAPRLPVSAFPNVRFRLWSLKEQKSSHKRKGKQAQNEAHTKMGKKHTHDNVDEPTNKIARYKMQCYAQSNIITQAERSRAGRQMARPIWMNLYVLCTQ